MLILYKVDKKKKDSNCGYDLCRLYMISPMSVWFSLLIRNSYHNPPMYIGFTGVSTVTDKVGVAEWGAPCKGHPSIDWFQD